MTAKKRKIRFHPGEGSFSIQELSDIINSSKSEAKEKELKNTEGKIKSLIELRRQSALLEELSHHLRESQDLYPEEYKNKIVEIEKQISNFKDALGSIRATKELFRPSEHLLRKLEEAQKAASVAETLAHDLQKSQKAAAPEKWLQEALLESQKVASSTGAVTEVLKNWQASSQSFRNALVHSQKAASAAETLTHYLQDLRIAAAPIFLVAG